MVRTAILALLLLGLTAGTAPAATRVAADGELTLRAVQGKGKTCITLRKGRRYRGQACGRVPRSPQRPLSIFPDVGPEVFAEAVAATVREVELEYPDGRRARHPTVAARGFGARFAVVAASRDARLVRYYDAAGALVGAGGGPAGYITGTDSAPVLGDGDEGATATLSPQLAPTPRAPDRLLPVACLNLFNAGGGNSVCDGSGPALGVLQDCGGRDLVAGVVGPDVALVRLTLGDGAPLDLAARDLPAAYGGRRAVADFVPAGAAVRSAAALDAAGTPVATAEVGSPPGGQPCDDETSLDGDAEVPFVPAAAPTGVAVAEAGGRALLVADQGEGLCAGLVALPRGACPPAPFDSDRPRLLRSGGTVAAVLGTDADRVTLRLDRGADVTVPTTTGPAYTGAWAGALRFLAAAVPPGRDVTGATVRAADGTVVGVSARGAAAVPVRRRVLASRDGVGVRLSRRAGAQPCVEAFPARLPGTQRYCTDPDPGTQIDGPIQPVAGTVVVGCDTAHTLAFGRLARGEPPPRITLAGGRSVRARRVRLAYDDAWVAFLPDAAVTGLRSSQHRLRLRLPARGIQCGYSVAVGF